MAYSDCVSQRHVVVIATGGTVGMGTLLGSPGSVPLSGFDLVSSICIENKHVDLTQVDLFTKPSASITLANVQTIADVIEQWLAKGSIGAVVTHGTDTLEETAFALSLLLDVKQPIVLTGAMRSPGLPGADGPANLTAAAIVASCEQAKGLGPVVLFDDELHAPQLVRKVHSSRTFAFSSAPFGPIGHLAEGRLDLVMTIKRRVGRLRVGPKVPAVPVIQAGLDLEPESISAFMNADVGAVVIAGAGGGHVSSRVVDAIAELAERMPVIITSRVGMGHTLSSTYAYSGSKIDLGERGVLNGGRWRPAQARILSQILLSNGGSPSDLAELLAE